eukprot:3022125-Pleurochrysis_carterae.AAC.2
MQRSDRSSPHVTRPPSAFCAPESRREHMDDTLATMAPSAQLPPVHALSHPCMPFRMRPLMPLALLRGQRRAAWDASVAGLGHKGSWL